MRMNLSDGACHCPEVVREDGVWPLCEVDRLGDRAIDLEDREPANIRCPQCHRGVYVAGMMPVMEAPEPWFDVQPMPLAVVEPGAVAALRCLAGCGWALVASSLEDEAEDYEEAGYDRHEPH